MYEIYPNDGENILTISIQIVETVYIFELHSIHLITKLMYTMYCVTSQEMNAHSQHHFAEM